MVESTADAIVIGGGIMGISIAHQLAVAKLGRIVVLEKTALGAGSTGKSGAILRQHYSHETTVRMAREGLRFYREFAERYDTDIGFRQPGMVFITKEIDRSALEANVKLQQRLGVDTRLFEHGELRDLEPDGLFAEDDIAAWEPEAGFVRPVETLLAIAQLAREQGVSIEIGRGVASIERDNNRATGVILDDGTRISSSIVINAGGPWAKALMGSVDLALMLEAIRPEQAYFQPLEKTGRADLIYGDLVTGMYWKPEDAGWTRVGKMSYVGDEKIPDPDHCDPGVSEKFIRYSRQQVSQRLPRFEHAVSWGGCGALYTITPDAHPLIGELPGTAGLYLVSGFSGHGFKLAPAVATGVAAMITGSTPPNFSAEFFAVDRFARGKEVGSSYQFGILG